MDQIQIGNHKILKDQTDNAIKLHSKTIEGIHNRKIQIEDQRRDFFKFIITLAIAIIGSSYFLNISKSSHLYFTGVCFLVFTIIFLILKLRESIDEESNALDKNRAESFSDYYDQINLALDYINKKKYSESDMSEYWNNFSQLRISKKSEEIVEMEKLKNKNFQNLEMDYSGELVIFLFLSGLFFTAGAAVPGYFNWLVILFGEIVLLLISCANTAKYIAFIFSKIGDTLVKKMLK